MSDSAFSKTPEEPLTAGPRSDVGVHAVSPFPHLPGYVILRELGRDGFGLVYLARQEHPERLVALKISKNGTVSWSTLARLRTEGEAIVQLRHPNIAALHAIEHIDGRPVLVFEYVEGGTLAERIIDRPLPPREAAELLVSLARAVHYAHRHGIIHGDLKPANILMPMIRTHVVRGASAISHDDTTADMRYPKIADFGLSQLHSSEGSARPGDVIGTPSYLSPEQAAGNATSVSHLADVYSLGAILYRLLTGRPPFLGDDRPTMLRQVISEEPTPPRQLSRRIPKDLETICLTCLRKKPGTRYSSADAVAEDLLRFLEDKPILARPRSSTRKILRWVRRRPFATLGLLLAFALLATLVVGTAMQFSQLRTERDQATRNFENTLLANDRLVSEVVTGARPLIGSQSAIAEQMLDQASTAYDVLQKEENSLAVRSAKGRMHMLFAGLYLDLNRSSKAMASATDAISLLERNLKERPNDTADSTNLAHARETLGRTLLVQGRLVEAEEQFQQALRLEEQLSAAAPSELRRKMAVASTRSLLALVKETRGDDATARTLHEEAIELAEQAALANGALPEWSVDLSVMLDRLGKWHLRFNESAEANRLFQGAIRVLEPAVRLDPDQLAWKGMLIDARAAWAKVLMTQGKFEQSRKLFHDNLELARGLAESDPRNPAWKRLVLRCRLGLQGTAPGNERDGPAIRREIALNRELQAETDSLTIQDPQNVEWIESLAKLRSREGSLYLELADRNILPREHAAAARVQFETAANSLDGILALDPVHVPWRRERIALESRLAYAQSAKANRSWLPAQDLEIALELELTTKYPGDPRHRHALADAWASKGNLYRALAESGDLPETHRRLAIAAFDEAKNQYRTLRNDFTPNTDWQLGEAEVDRQLREIRGK
ncbi:MAG: serine/threonine-protein kinase [Planctomycetes bacterium]|nr:serine/threonine-protein kinase [Planctomycetota bacterium]